MSHPFPSFFSAHYVILRKQKWFVWKEGLEVKSGSFSFPIQHFPAAWIPTPLTVRGQTYYRTWGSRTRKVGSRCRTRNKEGLWFEEAAASPPPTCACSLRRCLPHVPGWSEVLKSLPAKIGAKLQKNQWAWRLLPDKECAWCQDKAD